MTDHPCHGPFSLKGKKKKKVNKETLKLLSCTWYIQYIVVEAEKKEVNIDRFSIGYKTMVTSVKGCKSHADALRKKKTSVLIYKKAQYT